LSDEIGSSELTEWMAFFDIEPFGSLIDDIRAGVGPAVAINSKREKGAETVGPLHFFPWHKPPVEPIPADTAETRAAAIRALLQGAAPKVD
jgi:hypothetical protein